VCCVSFVFFPFHFLCLCCVLLLFWYHACSSFLISHAFPFSFFVYFCVFLLFCYHACLPLLNLVRHPFFIFFVFVLCVSFVLVSCLLPLLNLPRLPFFQLGLDRRSLCSWDEEIRQVRAGCRPLVSALLPQILIVF